MIRYRSRFLSRGEVWFDNEPGDTLLGLDWVLYHQRSRPVPGAKARFFYTFLIDLTQGYEELLSHLQKDTAYKIRRARERDRILCEYCDPLDPKVMDQFEQMYNVFAAAKGLVPLHRGRMQSLAAAGLLDLSVARSQAGQALLYHANYRDRSRAALLELPSIYRTLSDSAARNLIGRANRYLTWVDILHYKERGLRCFDFGGWYYGSDPAMLKINDFKRGFGGKVVREYQCEQTLSFKGWLLLRAAALWNRRKRVRAPSPGSEEFERPAAAASGKEAHSPTSPPVYTTPALQKSELAN